MSKTIFITGVAGFLGSHIADRMLEKGWRVIGCDTLLGGYLDNVPEEVEFHNVDCNDLAGMMKIIEGVDIVYHCAATAYEGLSVFSPHIVTQNIVGASTGIFTAAIANKCSRIIYCSCHDEKTRLMTKNGLKYFDEINKDDLVYTMNPETQNLEVQEIGEIFVYDYDGEMYSHNGKRLDFCVTPNHRFLLQNKRSGSLFYETAEKVAERASSLLPDCKWNSDNEIPPVWKLDRPNEHWNSAKQPLQIPTEDLFYLIGIFIGDKFSSHVFFAPSQTTDRYPLATETIFRAWVIFCAARTDFTKKGTPLFSSERRKTERK